MAFLVTIAGCSESVAPDIEPTPVAPDVVPGNWVSASVGEYSSCALNRSGHAYCWGNNFRGRLGTGSIAGGVLEPQPVMDAPAPLRSLSVGGLHQCALTANGAAFCWGSNEAGQLGIGSTGSVNTSGLVAGGFTFSSISAGYSHTCALAAEGVAYCWGDNTYNQLGVADAAPCGAMVERPCRVPAPVAVAGGLRFMQVSAGRFHTCGLTLDGAAYCWGINQHGELGDPAVPVHCVALPFVVDCIRDFPVPVGGGIQFKHISAGGMHSCGLIASGAAYCWGLVTREEQQIDASALGSAAHAGFHGASGGSRIPVPVEGGFLFTDVSAGTGRSCGLTIDGQARCWGSNNFGQLGIGTASYDRNTMPRLVRMPSAVNAPALDEDDHACAVSTSGQIWCWGGYNFFGELGSPPQSVALVSANVRPTPTPVVSAAQGGG